MSRSLLRKLIVRLLAGLLRLLPRGAPAGRARRVLVINPGHLGDVLLLTPALRALRAALPEASLVVLVGPWGEPALRGNPDLDAVLTCPFPGFTRAEKGYPWQPYLLLARMALLLRAGRFDAALVARDDHWWGALLALAAGISRRIGFAHPLVAPSLSEALPWDGDAHVTQQALALAGRLSNTSPGRSALRFEPSEDDRAWADRWLARHGLCGKPLVAIHPGTAGPAKLWPATRWAAVADALGPEVAVLLTGGKGEQALVADVAAAVSRPVGCMIGEATLGQLAALYARCAVVLGVDTGPLHVAVSQGVPSVHLFGPGNHWRFGPWGGEHNVVLRAGLWCSPCGVFTHCPRGTQPAECMQLLHVEHVVAAAREALHP